MKKIGIIYLLSFLLLLGPKLAHGANYVDGKKVDTYYKITTDILWVKKMELIAPPDGTADPLWSLKTTGTNQYGWDMGTLDLTSLGAGKYPNLTPRSNGVLGNGLGIIEGALLIGNTVTPLFFGQVIAFMDDATLAFAGFDVSWNYDGLGNNKINCSSELDINGSLAFNGDLTLDSSSEIIIPNTSQISFIGQNGYDSSITMVWSGSNYNMSFNDYSGASFGFAGGNFYVNAGTTTISNGGTFAGVGIQVFQTTGAWIDIPAIPGASAGIGSGGAGHSAWIAYAGHNADWFGDALVGDIIYRNQDGRILIGTAGANSDVLIDGGDMSVAGDVTVTNELKGCRYIFTGGRQSATSADNYAIIGVGGTLAYSVTQGFIMPRAGSITALSTNLNITTETTQGDIEIQARKNDSSVFTLTVNSGGAGAVVKSGYITQARGTDTFAAGDRIQLYQDFTTFVGTITGYTVLCEVVFND